MIDEVDKALEEYLANWKKLVSGRKDKPFFESLKPVAIGWKVADQAKYQKLYAELHDRCDKTIETWMNGRWIAKMHLRDTKLTGDIEIIKLMQRRPGSDDALGLDHVDFYSPEVKNAEQILPKEAGLKWTHETNNAIDNYNWISIWFDGGEAKIKDSTVLDIIIGELRDINAKITTA